MTIGDEFLIRNLRWSEQVSGRAVGIRLRYVIALMAFTAFCFYQLGAFVNGVRHGTITGLPQDTSVVRDIGSYMPELDRLEVGML